VEGGSGKICEREIKGGNQADWKRGGIKERRERRKEREKVLRSIEKRSGEKTKRPLAQEICKDCKGGLFRNDEGEVPKKNIKKKKAFQ